jgi:NAD(P)-dependent dehydrogenase (short-subunit alcohol dehydrogenase family)
MVADVSREAGPPTLLVTAAGRFGPVGPVWGDQQSAWWDCLDVNLRGTMLCCAAVVPSMLASHGGRIITVASRFGLRAAPGATAYACSKAAVLRLTDSLAAELQDRKVAVFATAPGPVRTALTEWPEEIARWQPDIPDSEWGTGERAGRLVVDLATGRWDALSGRFFHVDDDREALLRDRDDVVASDSQTLRLRAWASPSVPHEHPTS